MVIVHPTVTVLLVVGAIVELWIVFAGVYAALEPRSERSYWETVGDALRFRFSDWVRTLSRSLKLEVYAQTTFLLV